MSDTQDPDINNPELTNWSDYDDFLADAAKDDAIGAQEWTVISVVDDSWPSGDPRKKIVGQIAAAGNAKADLTLSTPPSPAELKAMKESGEMTSSRKMGIASTINLYKQLHEKYAKRPDDIAVGDTYKVQVTRDKASEDGRRGFLRVRAFLDKNHAVGSGASASTAATTSKAPF